MDLHYHRVMPGEKCTGNEMEFSCGMRSCWKFDCYEPRLGQSYNPDEGYEFDYFFEVNNGRNGSWFQNCYKCRKPYKTLNKNRVLCRTCEYFNSNHYHDAKKTKRNCGIYELYNPGGNHKTIRKIRSNIASGHKIIGKLIYKNRNL
jgi:hypothetical protein